MLRFLLILISMIFLNHCSGGDNTGVVVTVSTSPIILSSYMIPLPTPTASASATFLTVTPASIQVNMSITNSNQSAVAFSNIHVILDGSVGGLANRFEKDYGASDITNVLNTTSAIVNLDPGAQTNPPLIFYIQNLPTHYDSLVGLSGSMVLTGYLASSKATGYQPLSSIQKTIYFTTK